MDFFSLVPETNYKFNNKVFEVKDLWREIKLIVESDEDIFFTYKMMPEENFRIISYKFYGDEEYDWVFYVINGIYNEFDLPLTEKELYDYCIEKYGSEQELLKTKYFITPEIENYYGYISVPFGIVINGSVDESKPFYVFPDYEDEDSPVFRLVFPENCLKVTYYDWERKNNENKKNIKVLKKEYLNVVVNLIKKVID